MSRLAYAKKDVTALLQVFVASHIDRAKRELHGAKAMHRMDPTEYTAGAVVWCQHQVAALNVLCHTVETWERQVKRYLKRLDRDRHLLPQPKRQR
jgi:hypothetical protein